jgi:hypothetical protein
MLATRKLAAHFLAGMSLRTLCRSDGDISQCRLFTIAEPFGEPAMSSAEFLRAKAAGLRALAAHAKVPEVIVQLEWWAREFEEEAERIEGNAAAPTVLVIAPKIGGGA